MPGEFDATGAGPSGDFNMDAAVSEIASGLGFGKAMIPITDILLMTSVIALTMLVIALILLWRTLRTARRRPERCCWRQVGRCR